ncbi:hypothetical protein ILUMI_19510 [Ignelater luminosus]|uniref:Uncharacterized protein n=1 Tax=Ignelater luminosus TaxID=2038154 RepID=A0A8K0G5T4_IGNLU|nr:hypothetical protein ILUMI_19510 [Ignelater luminosus]
MGGVTPKILCWAFIPSRYEAASVQQNILPYARCRAEQLNISGFETRNKVGFQKSSTPEQPPKRRCIEPRPNHYISVSVLKNLILIRNTLLSNMYDRKPKNEQDTYRMGLMEAKPVIYHYSPMRGHTFLPRDCGFRSVKRIVRRSEEYEELIKGLRITIPFATSTVSYTDISDFERMVDASLQTYQQESCKAEYLNFR